MGSHLQQLVKDFSPCQRNRSRKQICNGGLLQVWSPCLMSDVDFCQTKNKVK